MVRLLPEEGSDLAMLNTVFKAIWDTEQDEIQEAFRYNGKPSYSTSHFDLNDLVALCESRALDVRA